MRIPTDNSNIQDLQTIYESMVEILELVGFEKELVIPQFLPFTMAGKRPPAPSLVRLYIGTRAC